MAIHYSQIEVELREVALNNKPPELIQASPKATVPVLILPNGSVIDESLDIMHWALQQNDPQNWLQSEHVTDIKTLINTNDSEFKIHLDHYKYADRFPDFSPAHYRKQAEDILVPLEHLLCTQAFLTGSTASLADIALLPFIRQFAHVDLNWFNSAPYPQLQRWLNGWLSSQLFNAIMQKQPCWQSHV